MLSDFVLSVCTFVQCVMYKIQTHTCYICALLKEMSTVLGRYFELSILQML